MTNQDIEQLYASMNGEVANLLTEMAEEHLSIETLETRNNDELDFHDVSVWGVKRALLAAYQAGWASAGNAAN